MAKRIDYLEILLLSIYSINILDETITPEIQSFSAEMHTLVDNMTIRYDDVFPRACVTLKQTADTISKIFTILRDIEQKASCKLGLLKYGTSPEENQAPSGLQLAKYAGLAENYRKADTFVELIKFAESEEPPDNCDILSVDFKTGGDIMTKTHLFLQAQMSFGTIDKTANMRYLILPNEVYLFYPNIQKRGYFSSSSSFQNSS